MSTQNLKSNPYVYPFVPFKNLADKEMKAKFTGPVQISTEELKSLVNDLQADSILVTGSDTAEKIYNFFIHDDVRFGPEEYISANRAQWQEKFNYFISQNKPLQFTILGFPFKMPVTIKTHRRSPDLGEVLALKRLHKITEAIKNFYHPGAIITVITEGVFGRFNTMSVKECDGYKKAIESIITAFGWDDTLRVIALDEMEKLDPNFNSRFEKKVKELEEKYNVKDPEFMKKYEGARESITRIINTRDLKASEETLMDVYNNELVDDQVNEEVHKIRKYIEKQTHSTLLRYHAYLMVRDDLNFLEKTIPHALTLSVSPKPNRLGIIPVHKNCIRLPYHAVPLVNMHEKTFSLEYLIDLKRMNQTFRPYIWTDDNEKTPFFYSY